ncbi:hypothetical protein N0V83_009241 [Neocucurbitaria cava]|uniref:Uncharacterized protein n=1 Tax=Neocucurbitaria cava TaxID=798079 RepID=A0A9W8Y3K8_9PLEO|nr:hypothetical protein N0V83_009241 [Neocucurbitaria cava]
MQYLIFILSLLVLKANAIDFILFDEDDCATEDDPNKTCIDLNYGDCCGTFSTSGDLYGAAAVSTGSTPIQNTPTLRAYNEGGTPVAICGQIRASWTLANDPNNPGTFPCAVGPAPSTYNGFKVESVVTGGGSRKRGESLGSVVEPNGYGVLENGTIYAVKQNSQLGQLYKEMEGKMTTKERRSFIINHAENKEGANAKVFRA